MRGRVAFLTDVIRGRGKRSGGSAPKGERTFGQRLRSALRMQKADADEVIQEAAIALWRAKGPIDSLPAWFTRTAKIQKLRLCRLEAQARSFAPRLSAEIQLRGSPYPAPDAEAEHRFALRRLIKRVHPGRQAVAALGLAGHGAAQIAAALKLPENTVKSRWARARKDIGGPAVVLALLAGVWLWVVARGKRLAGAFTGSGRGRVRALAASAAVPLLVAGHAMIAAPREPDLAWDEPESMAERGAGPRYTFSPMLHTNAEREREWAAGARAASPALSEDSRPDAEDPEERGILDQALTALQQGHLGVAEDALRLYDSERPDNPFPSLRAQVASGLAAAGMP